MSRKSFITAEVLHPIKSTVFVTDLEQGAQKTVGGIIIPDDDMRDRGIRQRWAKIYAIGPDVTDIAVGEWVLVAHGRWTPGIDMQIAGEHLTVWRIEYPEAVLLVAEGNPVATVRTML